MHILFFLKKAPLHAGLGSKQHKPLTTAKQLIRKNFCLLFEKSGYFLGLNPPPPPPSARFRSLFKDPLSTTNILFKCPLST